jgi:hypothetical protein
MAGVAQLVRAAVCGSVGRGFKSHHSPQILFSKTRMGLFITAYFPEMLHSVLRLNPF